MATSDFAIVSLADTKAFLNATGEDTNRDTYLETEIDAVSTYLESYLNRRIVARTYRERAGADLEDYTLYPENTPILEVHSIHDDPDLNFNDDSLLDTDDYNVFEDRVEFRAYESPFIASALRRRWRRVYTANTVQIEYVAGYGFIEVPFSRQRIDFQEESGGDRLTANLNFGQWSPKAIVDELNIVLNAVGDHTRKATFDWTTRQFTITQTDGDLTLLPSVSNEFAETDSALPLLGYTGSSLTGSPITSDAVTLALPAALKTATLNLIALQYDKGNYGEHNSRGLRSIQIDDYRAEYANGQSGEMGMAGMPREIESMLTQYRKAIYV